MVNVGGKIISSKEVQELNASFLIVSTEEGIVILVNEEHWQNPESGIYVIEDGSSTFSSEEHDKKAE